VFEAFAARSNFKISMELESCEMMALEVIIDKNFSNLENTSRISPSTILVRAVFTIASCGKERV
jgi:hypothetical protein